MSQSHQQKSSPHGTFHYKSHRSQPNPDSRSRQLTCEDATETRLEQSQEELSGYQHAKEKASLLLSSSHSKSKLLLAQACLTQKACMNACRSFTLEDSAPVSSSLFGYTGILKIKDNDKNEITHTQPCLFTLNGKRIVSWAGLACG